MHLISEQDNRGQLVIQDNYFKMPNPHFMTSDLFFNSSGYGVDSYYNFFDYFLSFKNKNSKRLMQMIIENTIIKIKNPGMLLFFSF